MSELVLYDTRGPAAWITLNRPEKLNAISRAMVDDLHEVLALALADDAVKIVVLTGAGKAFSAGYDIAEEVADGLPGFKPHQGGRAGVEGERPPAKIARAAAELGVGLQQRDLEARPTGQGGRRQAPHPAADHDQIEHFIPGHVTSPAA